MQFNQVVFHFHDVILLMTQKRLLDPANKSKTITDIYLEVGFNSKSVFNTFFKKLVGKTPSEYRQQPADSAAHTQ